MRDTARAEEGGRFAFMVRRLGDAVPGGVRTGKRADKDSAARDAGHAAQPNPISVMLH
jgi:hypothetical protein